MDFALVSDGGGKNARAWPGLGFSENVRLSMPARLLP
jgi:hypothetical protein